MTGYPDKMVNMVNLVRKTIKPHTCWLFCLAQVTNITSECIQGGLYTHFVESMYEQMFNQFYLFFLFKGISVIYM